MTHSLQYASVSKRNLMRNTIIIVVVFLVLGTVTGAYYFSANSKPEYEVVTAERRDLTEELTISGRVVAAQQVDLAFENSGKVSAVRARVGDRVNAGSLLVSLDHTGISADLLEAEARIQAEQALLGDLKRGSRPEELRVAQVKVANARVALEDARRDLKNKMRDAFTKSDDAVRNAVDQLYTNPRTNPALDKFTVSDSALRIELERRRLDMEKVLVEWRDEAPDTSARLGEIMAFLDRVAYMVNGLVEGASLTKSILEGYKTDIAAARTNTNTAVVNVSTAEEKVRKAESDVALAEEELALKKIGATEEKIAAQEAALDQAKARASSIRAKLEKTALHAPFRGVVTVQDAKVGAIVSANMPVVSLIADGVFEIEAVAPEIDIPKIAGGDAAKITLDAYGYETVFAAVVTRIDPAETIVEGVVTYTVTLRFEKADERIKSGMTANVAILTEKREQVVAIPSRAVEEADGTKIVRVRKGGVVVETPVVTGLEGLDGFVEIQNGILENEEVVMSVQE